MRRMNRDGMLDRIVERRKPWDFIVVGGGANWCRRSDSNRHGLVVRGILSSVGEGDRRIQEDTTAYS